MADIKFDKRNYRKHGDKNKKLIKKSLDELGAGRSIVIDSEGEVIGGNGVFEAWGDRPVRVIETDGSELVVVQRTDLKTDDEKRKKLAIMDNSTSDSSTWDMSLLQADFDVPELAELGVDIKIKDAEQEEPEVKFTEELLEEHNYVVLYFDNSVDWLQVQSILGLESVHALSSRPGFEKKGVGRVVRGAEALEKIRENMRG